MLFASGPHSNRPHPDSDTEWKRAMLAYTEQIEGLLWGIQRLLIAILFVAIIGLIVGLAILARRPG